jgi:hypothetical protein
MIEVCNKLFQPLTVTKPSGTGLHLGPRASVRIADDEVSPAMRRAAQRGLITLRPVPTATATAKKTAATAPQPPTETKEG